MSEKQVKPKVGFSNNSEQYSVIKFENIAMRKSKNVGDEKLPRIEFEDINSGKGTLNKNIYTKDNKHKIGIYFEEEDILFGKLRPYLKNWYFASFKGVAIGDFWVFKARKDIDSLFLYALIQSENYQYISNISIGSKMPRSDWDLVSNYKFTIPSFKTQQKIGDLFEKLDQVISLQQQVLEATKDYKQSMLQKMFPKKDEKVPEIRFEGFNDFWKGKKIKEISKNMGGTALEKHTDSHGHYKFISIGNYSKDGKYIDNGQRISLNEKTREKLLQKNDIAMVLNDKTKTGDIIGSSILIDEDNKYIYNQRTQRVVFDKKIVDSTFIWTSLNNNIFRSEVFRRSQGGTQIYINFSEVEKIIVKIPSLEEQQKIGSFFKTLDEKIGQEEKKLETYQSMKKALMQRMFV